MILNRNIVIKREGNKLLLPTIERKEVNAPTDSPATIFFMCRIVSYDQNSGTIKIAVSRDVVNEGHYKIAIEENSDLLSPLLIRELILVRQCQLPTFQNAELEKYNHKRKVTTYQGSRYFEKSDGIIDKEKNSVKRSTEKEKANLSIELPVKDMQFCDGKVCFDYFIPQVNGKVRFEISNLFIKKEFDSIKNYFPKVLNLTRFPIALEFEYLDRQILSYTCTSIPITKIDETLFELVEDMYITDRIINNNEDEVYTLNDMALVTSKEIGSEKLQDPYWILNKVVLKGKTKHYYHLRYLSDKQLADISHLRLTGKPLSFIFLIAMENNYYFIWETYLTEEATYIWKLKNITSAQLNNHIQEIVERIKWLRNGNKMAYIKSKPSGFIKIEHDYSGEDFGFKKWKSKLEDYIYERHEV